MKKSRGEQDLENFEQVFKALSNECRRNILIVLQSRGGTMTAGDIVKRFSFAWPTVTRHLRQLEEAGLISADKVSREQLYTINNDKLVGIVESWIKWFK